jgi:succinyl-CoA synthetase beta subunit
MLEINPLFKAADDKIIAVDCKMSLDENALPTPRKAQGTIGAYRLTLLLLIKERDRN